MEKCAIEALDPGGLIVNIRVGNDVSGAGTSKNNNSELTGARI